MKIAALGGNRAHAPANSRLALVSAYTGGADILQIAVRLCHSGRLVLADAEETTAATGTPGSIRAMNVSELRQLDFSVGFVPRGHAPGEFSFLDHRVPDRRFAIDALDEVLDDLPAQATLWFDLRGPDGDVDAFRHGAEVLAGMIEGRARASRCLFSCVDPGGYRHLQRLLPDGQFVTAFAGEATPAADLVAFSTTARRVTADLQNDLAKIAAQTASGKWPRGAILLTSGQIQAELVEAVAHSGSIAALGVESTFDASGARRSYVKVDEDFAGTETNRALFALGYAKANRFGSVSWNDGVHIDIAPYDGDLPDFHGNPLERAVERLRWDVVNVAREWPFYSGGGLGVRSGITGDFAAEVDYRVQNVGQATTLEMAVVNADPGAHQATPPASFRDKDSFFDPHGAPPFVGVEHDEDDGYRINWNLGTEYDNNQYGRPIGDGRTPRGARLRLERRGSWFAGYYRAPVDEAGNNLAPRDWVCVGVARNESLNRTVHLRCVGKRWRQEKASDPTQHEPILANRFTYRNLKIVCFPAVEGA